MMIYITGDTHAEFNRFSSENFPEQKTMTKQDYVIICGDFGGVWDGSKREKYWLDWLEDKPFTTLFVSGNHENYDLLSGYTTEYWHGGKVQFIRPTILHLMRGQMFDLCEKRFFTMGGASSHDISDGILEPDAPDFRQRKKELDARLALYRVNHHSWWADELPNDMEYQEAEDNLDACARTVDYILSHCCPSSIMDAISGGMYRHDRLTDYFETLMNNCRFQYWFFGHYHDNRVIDRKYILLYEQIVQME
ncbi:MAG: metallophosphoesterase family protein [Acutalibacteraceae bacterium]|jgi:DNA repair exonuclease SbcCD nuclease subunit